MSFKKKVQNKILESSDTYNFYKNQYESGDSQLEKRISKLEDEHNRILDSYNNLFNIIFQDYELKPKGVLKYSQEFCMEILFFVEKICEKYGLEYWIDYGNLLGAVRHGGYIPWDDDMDLGMMRKDYETYLGIIDDELKANGLDDCFELRYYKNDKVIFLQMMYKAPGFGLIGGLDIMPHDFIKSHDETTEDTFRVEKNNLKRTIREGGDIDKCIENYMKAMNATYEKADYIICGAEGSRSPFSRYSFDVLETDKVFPLSDIEFNGVMVKAPGDPDYWLTSIYGDYHKIHKVVDIHTRLYNIKRRKGAIDVYKEHIAKFRKVNENFKV